MASNLVILRQMIRLSGIVKELKEVRCKSNLIVSKTDFFLIEGDHSNMLKESCKSNVTNCLYLEQYLRSSVSKACKCLDGFNPNTMDPVDYISSSDVKDKYVDLCRGNRVVATINLTTGFIEKIEPELASNLGEDKSPVEKS